MNQITEYNKSLKEGEKKLESNEYFKDLCGWMENEQLKRLLDKHMNNWLDIKCSVTYLHLFKQFKERYEKVNEKELDNRIIVYLLAKIMRDKNLRPWSITTIDKMLTNHKVNFFEEFESMMVANKDLNLLT